MSLKKHINRYTLATLFLGMTLYSGASQAKGLDALTPETDAKETKDTKDTQDKKETKETTNDTHHVQAPKESTIPKSAPQPETTDSQQQNEDELKPTETTPEAKQPETKTESVEKPVERSATSLALEDKLQFTAGLNVGKLKGKNGSWANRGSGDLGLAYMISGKVSPKNPLFIIFNYRPFDSVVAYEEQTYRSVTEGFFFGIKKYQQLKETFYASAAVQLGYVKNSVTPTDGLTPSATLNHSDAMLTASTALEWKLRDKIFLGPQFLLGFGSVYSAYSLGLTTSLTF